MRKLPLIAGLMAISAFCFSSSLATITAKDAPAKGTFHHHSGEFTLAPSADYFFYRPGDIHTLDKPYEFHMPFIGFNMGAQYLYRPIELFGVSSGLNFRMQGYYNRITGYTLLGEKYVSVRNSGHQGYVSVPICFHLYKQMPHSTFEFATGPEFFFPLFRTSYTSHYDGTGAKISSAHDMTKFTGDYTQKTASLGWNIFLGAEVNLCEASDLFIGPQINFLSIAFFNKDLNKNGMDVGRFYDCSLGLKLGFRFHDKGTK